HPFTPHSPTQSLPHSSLTHSLPHSLPAHSTPRLRPTGRNKWSEVREVEVREVREGEVREVREVREGEVVMGSTPGSSEPDSDLLRASFPVGEPVDLCHGLSVLISSPDARVRPVYRTLPARRLIQAPRPGNLSLKNDSHGNLVVSWEVPDLTPISRLPSSLVYNVCMTDRVGTICIERKEPMAFMDNEKVHHIAVQALLCDSWDGMGDTKKCWDHRSEWQHLVIPARTHEDEEGQEPLVAMALVAPVILVFLILCLGVKYRWMVKAHVWPRVPGPCDLLLDLKVGKEQQLAQAPTCRVPEEIFSSVEIISECQSSEAARQPLIPSIATAPPPPPPPPSAASVVVVAAAAVAVTVVTCAGPLAAGSDYCSLAQANAGTSAWRPG
ncbi:uncharacterized protein LOC133357319, partial [Lethenteron reissneri]|uniref:uncharacterized protein LOC133357319 n=1 Tax=Lethenteron reissneri TaxID=7753 RepID=UPI002AB69681